MPCKQFWVRPEEMGWCKHRVKNYILHCNCWGREREGDRLGTVNCSGSDWLPATRVMLAHPITFIAN